MLVAANALISVTPGLMIWTIVCFLIALFVLKRYAFGPIQKVIDERRERIRVALQEADDARAEARRMLEEHRALIGQARGEAEEILSEARRTRESMERRGGGGDGDRRPGAPRGDTARDPGRDAARARADPQRGRGAHARRRDEGHREGARS